MPITIIGPDGEVLCGKTEAVLRNDSPLGGVGDNSGPSVQDSGTPNPPVGSASATPCFTPTRGQLEACAAVEALIKVRGAGGLIIKGYAGVGKTTMLRLLGEKYGRPVVLTPTGKAALRVTDATGLQASTIHRWLYTASTDPKTNKASFKLKPADQLRLPGSRLVLVDEASMIGRDLWLDLWRAAETHDLRVVLVGDGFQLPPVADRGAEEFSTMGKKFSNYYGFKTVELTEVVRQAQGSPVVRSSMKLRESAAAGYDGLAELPHVERDNLLDTCRATFDAGGVVIAHTNVTRQRVNQAMRYDKSPEGPEAGEPFLVLRNNYELDVYNGEQVTFEGWDVPPSFGPNRIVDPYNKTEGVFRFGCARVNGSRCVVCLEQLSDNLQGVGGWSIMVGAERWAKAQSLYDNGKPTPFLEVNYGYCYTAHKAQGSEWPYALVILEPSVKLNTEDGRRWAYTAITRASKMTAIFSGRP